MITQRQGLVMDDIFVDLRAAGLPTPSSLQGRHALARQLGFSHSHLDNVMSARKPYCGKLRDKIQGLIAAKGKGPSQDIIDQADDSVEPAAPDPVVVPSVFAPVIERAEPDLRSEPQLEKRYRVVGRDVRVEQFTSTRVATFESTVDAAKYANWLNDQIKRGKEAG